MSSMRTDNSSNHKRRGQNNNPRGVHGLGQMKRIQQMTEAITL